MSERLSFVSERINRDGNWPGGRTIVLACALSGPAPLLRVRPELQYVCQFEAEWASDHAAESDKVGALHIVNEGCRTLHLEAANRSVSLQAGDACFPHGSAYVVDGRRRLTIPRVPLGIRSRSTGAISSMHGRP